MYHNLLYNSLKSPSNHSYSAKLGKNADETSGFVIPCELVTMWNISLISLHPVTQLTVSTSKDTILLHGWWNNGFRRIFNCCRRESVKPLKFYCQTLLISYLIGERQLLFYRRLLCSDNIVLCTLTGLMRFEMLGMAAKFDIKSTYFTIFPQQQLRTQFGHYL